MGHALSLLKEVAKHFLRMAGQGGELPDDVGQGAVGHAFQLVGDRILQRAPTHVNGLNQAFRKRHREGVESVRFARSDYKYEWGERFKAATKTRQIAIKAKGSSNFGPCFLGDRRQENGAGAPNVSPLAVSRARGHSFSFGSFELVWETKKGYCCFSCWELEVGGSLR